MIVFVCSRHRGSAPGITQDNVRRTIAICRALALSGHMPIAPHLYLTRFLNDEIETERALGIHLGQRAMLMCDEVVYDDTRDLSEGMDADLEFADAQGKRVSKLSDWIATFDHAGGLLHTGVLEALRKGGIIVVGGA